MKPQINTRSGVALVIVLGFLVIISALAVAFFSSVTTELKASRTYASGVSTRQLAESAVNLVMGQISEATSRTDAAWASQPGMIRVYGGGSGTSNALNTLFKLYSSDNMVVTSTDLTNFLKDPDYVADWNVHPALWTDLNAPVVSNGVPRFPIIDPRAKGPVEGFDYETTKVALTLAGATDNRRLPMPVRWVYILQDGTLSAPVTGSGSSGTGAKFPTTGYKAPSKENPIVGRIAFWTDDETCKVNLNTAGGFIDDPDQLASYTAGTYYALSPDRFAGSYWDTPRFYTEFDRGMPFKESDTANAGRPREDMTSGGLALCQLLQNEFQRYPGHPATTSLGLVFTEYNDWLGATNSAWQDKGKALFSSEQLYELLPRLGTSNAKNKSIGSSKGGTARVIKGKELPNPTPDDMQIQYKTDRLYSSVDELFYNATTSTDGVATVKDDFSRQRNDEKHQIAGNPITEEFVDRYRFFITAQSRSPELNLFGQPRVSIWPVRSESSSDSKSGLNHFDNVILFCSTIGNSSTGTVNRPDTKKTPSAGGPYRYIFTRREITPGVDTTKDPTRLEYILPTNYKQDIDLDRNKELISYLQRMTDNPIPGVGASFKSKLTGQTNANRDGLLHEIFDYIRCVNVQDTTSPISATTTTEKNIQFSPRGIIMPSVSSNNRGFGRVPTISDASLVFYYAGPKMNPAVTVTNPNDNVAAPESSWWDQTTPGTSNRRKYVLVPATGAKKSTRLMRAFLLFSTFNPVQGYAPFKDPEEKDPKMRIEVTWATPWSVKFPSRAAVDPLLFPTTASTTIYRGPGGAYNGRNFGGYEGFMHTLIGNGSAAWAPYKIQWKPGVNLGASGAPLSGGQRRANAFAHYHE